MLILKGSLVAKRKLWGWIVGRTHILISVLLLCFAAPWSSADEFTLKDGGRVVLVGNTLIEREQHYGYWEAALTSRFAKQRVMFRNLGWSGDTVFGIARAEFGTPQDGFRHLKDHVESLKPTVILVAYGTNESFDGEAGVPRFQQGLDTLLDALAKTGARIVLLSPAPFEKLGKPLPDPTVQNRNLALYRDVLKATAGKREMVFVDLFEALQGKESHKHPTHLTDNGMHFTAQGYYWSAFALERGLGLKAPEWHVEVDAAGSVTATGTKVTQDAKNPLAFTLADSRLPLPIPAEARDSENPAPRTLQVRNLKAGQYTLRVDGNDLLTASAEQWAKGQMLRTGSEFDQAEKLRQAIIAKNREYFHRWRPENDTYLFGFRRQEQGQNSVEIPQFDPIVAKLEDQIAKLRVPVSHKYEIVPAK